MLSIQVVKGATKTLTCTDHHLATMLVIKTFLAFPSQDVSSELSDIL
jgi:hypothetical protein